MVLLFTISYTLKSERRSVLAYFKNLALSLTLSLIVRAYRTYLYFLIYLFPNISSLATGRECRLWAWRSMGWLGCGQAAAPSPCTAPPWRERTSFPSPWRGKAGGRRRRAGGSTKVGRRRRGRRPPATPCCACWPATDCRSRQCPRKKSRQLLIQYYR